MRTGEAIHTGCLGVYFMDDKEMAALAATILGGFIVGERSAMDEKTVKRSIDLAFRLKTLVMERVAATACAPLPTSKILPQP